MKAPKQIEQLSLSEELEEVTTSRESSSESTIVTTSCLALFARERVELALFSTLLKLTGGELSFAEVLETSLTSSDINLSGDTFSHCHSK